MTFPVFFEYFSCFWSFFEEFGVGVRGVFVSSYPRNFGFQGFWIPVAGRAFLNTSTFVEVTRTTLNMFLNFCTIVTDIIP